MAALQIEGEIEGIRSVQIEFIRGVLDKRGFTNNRVVFEPTVKVGDNYVANVKRITVIVEGGDDFKMVAKLAPEQETLRAIMNTAVLFNNETLMYQEVLPKLVALQKAADVPEEDILRYAECYGCLTEPPNEVILLEDLKESNYVMLDKMSYLSDSAVRLILKNFAILHSLSFVLKKSDPEAFDRYRTKLVDMWSLIAANPEFKIILNQLEEGAIAVVDEQYKNAFRGVVTQMPDLVAKLTKTDSNSKNLVIQQGDGWTNNILFKLEDDRETECVMIDYQVSRGASPVCDIIYMTFNCTNHATRAKHYLDWIDYYHDQLDRSLSNFGMEANFVYPKDQLDTDLKRYSKVFFITSVMLQGTLIRKPEEAQAFKDAMSEFDVDKIGGQIAVDTLSNDSVVLYKSRLEGLVDSYRLFGYM